MSANHYDVCPRCKARAVARAQAARAEAERSYGKVGRERYKGLCREAARLERAGVPETLREDWEIGISDGGEFFVVYRAACQHCGFGHRFRHEEQLTIKEESR